MHSRVRQLIELLELRPHPDGGHYRELFRSGLSVQPADARPPRAALTTIYFLLEAGQHSAWHRVRSDEVWHFYEGEPLELHQAAPDLALPSARTLAPVSTASAPVHTVPAGWWQAARPLGSYALVGCTVGPGFEFEDFSFLRDAPDQERVLRSLGPELARLL